MHTPGGPQEMTIINESGLYSLILTSRKPEAKKFKKWVTSEVLPAIRKTGKYVHPDAAKPRPAVERISTAQYHQLRQVVGLMEMAMHRERAVNHAAWGAMRSAFGLERSIADLPATRFDEAFDFLKQIEKLCWEFKGKVMDAEAEFCRNVIRRGKRFDAAALEAILFQEGRELFSQRDMMLDQMH